MNAVRHVRIFKNGRSRAVRIPKEFDIFGDEVAMHEEDGRLVLEPARKRRSLGEILATLAPIDEEWPEIEDPPAEPVDLFDD